MQMHQAFRPILGRIVVELIKDDVEDYMKEQAGISKDSKLVLPDEFKQNFYVPVGKGKVTRIGSCSFGERFKRYYGEDCAKECQEIKPGDIVYFVATQSYALDNNKHHIINDEQILGVVKAEAVNL